MAWNVYAEVPLNGDIAHCEQALYVNDLIVRNKLFDIEDVLQAMQLFTFLLYKYPLASIHVRNNKCTQFGS
jgi:hypothetical protein